MVAATFLDLLWTTIIIFFMIAFFMLLFQVIGDLFRRDDASGGKKVLWVIVLLLFPFVGLLVYFITNGDGMAKRQVHAVQQAQQSTEAYIREVAGGSVDQIEKAKRLLDAGTITQAEFDALKAKALS